MKHYANSLFKRWPKSLPGKAGLLGALVLSLLAARANAQFVITDVGQVDPIPGPSDVYYFNTNPVPANVQNNDGLNYYWDNGSWPGQTFTTGANPGGYTLTNLSLKTGGNGGNNPLQTHTFQLRIYSVSGTTATLVTNYSATTNLVQQGNWLRWNNLAVSLAPNTLYAYAFSRGTGNDWEQMANNGQNPYADGQICLINPGTLAVTYGNSQVSDAQFNVGLTLGSATPGGAVTLADIGANPPTPGANDISQLQPLPPVGPQIITYHPIYGLNYYWDSGAGQTFTTPASSLPWVMTNLFVRMGYDSGSGQFNSQNFSLIIYSVSGGGTTATKIYSNSYTTSVTANGNWVQCSGFSVVLQPNQQYAYTFNRGNGSYMELAAYDGNQYAGGKICLIGPNGGTINYGSQGSGANSADAAFAVGLTAPLVYATQPTISPSTSPIYAGSPVTLNEAAVGTGTLSYQWRTDGGTGIFTNIPSAVSSNLVVDTTGFISGTYNYDVVVTTTAGGGVSSTSSVVTLTITDASAPTLTTDTTPTPNTTSSYVGLSQTFATAFVGTLPISYQWYKATDAAGTGAAPVANATNATLTLANLQLSDAGYYSVTATNAVAPFSASSTWAQLDVLPASQMLINWQTPVSFQGMTAGQILTNTTPGKFFEGAYFGPMTTNITVTVAGVTYNFYGDDSTVALSGHAGKTSGCWLSGPGNTTGDTNLDTVLDQFAYDGGATHSITLRNLMPGSNYCVQLFSLDNRGAGATRFTTFQDPANNADVSASFGLSENKYVVGTFTAPGTELVIQQNLVPASQGNTCAVIVGTVGWTPTPVFTLQPANVSTYPGRVVQFNSGAIGSPAPTFQWQVSTDGGLNFANVTDGVLSGATISGATSNLLTVANVGLAQSSWQFRNTATNASGGSFSAAGVLTVLTPPANSAVASTAVLQLNPVAYWPLNEFADPSVGGVAAYDAAGLHDGTYGIATQNGSSSILGPQAGDGFPQFPSGQGALATTYNIANSWVTTPALNLNTNTITISMWVYPNGPQAGFAGLFMNRNAATTGGLHLGNGNELRYTWVENTATTWGHATGLILPENVWSYVALVTTATNTTWYLYNSAGGLQTHTYTVNNTVIPWNGSAANIRIGCDNGPGRNFNGSIDEVAIFNRALNSAEVMQLATAAPTVTIAPAGANLQVAWPFGTLLEASTVTGPWTTNVSSSPYNFAPTGAQKFFRVQAQ